MNEPAFRKWTPAVERGIRYAVASLEFDAEHEPDPIVLNFRTGETRPAETAVDNADLKAAAVWLRAQIEKRE